MTQDDRELLARIDERTARLLKQVEGNGQPGILQRLSTLEAWQSRLIGAWLFVMAAVGIWAAVK